MKWNIAVLRVLLKTRNNSIKFGFNFLTQGDSSFAFFVSLHDQNNRILCLAGVVVFVRTV